MRSGRYTPSQEKAYTGTSWPCCRHSCQAKHAGNPGTGEIFEGEKCQFQMRLHTYQSLELPHETQLQAGSLVTVKLCIGLSFLVNYRESRAEAV